MDIGIIQKLLEKYLKKEASPAEQKLIEEWLEFSEVTDNDWFRMTEDQRSAWTKKLESDIHADLFQHSSEPPTHRLVYVPRFRRLYFQIAAAVFILAAGIGFWKLLKTEPAPPLVKVEQRALVNDALPGTNKAILTLADGSSVQLDDSGDGVLAKEGETEVEKAGYALIYNAAAEETTEAVTYNTLATPKGGQYQLVLPDGSKVWLNAASRIKYPVRFSEDRREVEIYGEAYFEVKPRLVSGKKVSFVVHITDEAGTHKGDVEVLGTSFNVNAYDDENNVRATLVEGSVKVHMAEHNGRQPVARTLTPGQQARWKNENMEVLSGVDVEEVVAWKNGLFMMSRVSIAAVLRQLARWYDVDIEYRKGEPTGRISGDIPRDMNLSEVLKVMSLSGVNFKIEGKKIIVEP